MVVNLLGRLDRPVAKTVPHIVQRVALFGVHHPVGNAVTECVRRHVVELAAGSIDLVGLDLGFSSNLVEHIPNGLRGAAVTRPGREQCLAIFPPVREVRRQQPGHVVGQFQRRRRWRVLVWVVFLDLARQVERTVVVTQHPHIYVDEFADSKSGVSKHGNDGFVPLLEVVGTGGVACRSKILDLGWLQPYFRTNFGIYT